MEDWISCLALVPWLPFHARTGVYQDRFARISYCIVKDVSRYLRLIIRKNQGTTRATRQGTNEFKFSPALFMLSSASKSQKFRAWTNSGGKENQEEVTGGSLEQDPTRIG